MSQDYHQGVFSFFDGFERSVPQQQDKLRVQGFEHSIEDKESGGLPAYETGGMLSEMFKYLPPGETVTARGLLENQISGGYRDTRPSLAGEAATGDWFLNRQEMVVGGGLSHVVDSKNQMSSINADSAAVMRLFLMNPQQQSSLSSPSPSDNPTVSTSSTLHMLLPDPSSNSSSLLGFHSTAAGGAFGQITWGEDSGCKINQNRIPGVLEGRGLSLSLSSSLQHLEVAKGDDLRNIHAGNGEMILLGHAGGPAPPHDQLKNLAAGAGGGVFHLHGGVDQNRQMQVGLGSSFGALNILKNSKYTRSAQELLEEFCSVGNTGHFKKNKLSKHNNNANPVSSDHPAGATSGGGGGGNSSYKEKDVPPPSAADRLEHQRRKVKLLSMLDEVDRKYSHYCEQMRIVMSSFETVMGSGAAAPYTFLGQKAMSKHFRGLKEAILAQLKHSCEILGERDAVASSLTKGETPRLRILEQSLRQHRGIHQMSLMEQEAWRPQRGLPERSVNILRAWLFEHFLNPYPSDADKHLLARQTGLSRNQVSNWFINARVRLWKPMVEEMYQKESKDESEEQEQDQSSNSPINNDVQTPTPNTTGSSSAATIPPGKRCEINASEIDPLSKLQPKNNPPLNLATTLVSPSSTEESLPVVDIPDLRHRASIVSGTADYGTSNHPLIGIEPTLVRLGTNAGDLVSLTLGLRHAGNLPEKRQFSVRDFGGC